MPTLRAEILRLRSLNWTVITWVLFTKLALFFFAAVSVAAFSGKSPGFWETWNRWDAQRYLQLAREGYLTAGDARFNLVGLPLYPWLTRAVSWSGCDIRIAAFLVSGVASLAAALLLLQLVRFDEEEGVSLYAIWFLLIYPTSYFLNIAYTEATLLALVLGSFVAARKKAWLWAGVLGGLASMTRLPGIVVLPALLFEAWEQYRVARRFEWRWLWLAIVPCGLGIYLWINYALTGDPLAFSKLFREHFYQSLASPWIGLRNVFRVLDGDQPDFVVMSGGAEAFFSILAIAMTTWSWFVLRPSYSIWMTGTTLLCISNKFIQGVPRYTLVMFPIFILFARAARGRPLVFAMISFPSLILLSFFVSKFALGHWAF